MRTGKSEECEEEGEVDRRKLSLCALKVKRRNGIDPGYKSL